MDRGEIAGADVVGEGEQGVELMLLFKEYPAIIIYLFPDDKGEEFGYLRLWKGNC